jgi:hypothetical protein
MKRGTTLKTFKEWSKNESAEYGEETGRVDPIEPMDSYDTEDTESLQDKANSAKSAKELFGETPAPSVTEAVSDPAEFDFDEQLESDPFDGAFLDSEGEDEWDSDPEFDQILKSI